MRLSTKGRYAVMAMVDLARRESGRETEAVRAVALADIVHAVDEPLRATRCGAGKGCMIKGERCLTHDLWADLGERIEEYLASVSLADVATGRLTADRRAA